MNINEIKTKLNNRELDERLMELYVDEELLNYQTKRYLKALDEFEKHFDDQDVIIYSAAGRSEVGGNHTDHQHGQVLASAINLDAIAITARQETFVDIISDGFELVHIDINDLTKKETELSTSIALVRGVLAKLKEEGYKIGGFKAYITSDVLIGAGLSSSASFEVLIATIISGLYNDNQIDKVNIAKIGQYAENVYFGKPCGLMDQCACSVGGLINIDFKDINKPVVKAVEVDFSKFKHSLCIVDTKGDHSDLTNEYASIPLEMKEIAHYFNQEYLADVDENKFYEDIFEIRKVCSDRAILRAHHFFNDNKRVNNLLEALEKEDFEAFKTNIKASGDSSYKYLQNVFASSDALNQSMSLALAISEMNLKNHGVSRVHGGGFAGTIQAFVEDEYVSNYKEAMDKLFGEGSCHVLKIRNVGGCEVLK